MKDFLVIALSLSAIALVVICPLPASDASASTPSSVSYTWDFSREIEYTYNNDTVTVTKGELGISGHPIIERMWVRGTPVAIDATDSGHVYLAENYSIPGDTPEEDMNRVRLIEYDWKMEKFLTVLVKEGTGYECGAAAVSLDPDGVLVAGHERVKNNTPHTSWLRKYSRDLNFIWKKTFAKQAAVSVASDSYGNSVIGTVPYREHTANITRFDKNGGTTWSKKIADGTFDYQLEDVACDWNGDVIVAGSYCPRGKDQRWQWVRKLNGSDGSQLWEYKMAPGRSDQQAEVTAVVADHWGNVVTAGENCLKLGCSDGALIWVRHPIDHAMCYDVDVDSDNTYWFITDALVKNKYTIGVCQLLPSGQKLTGGTRISGREYNARFASIACAGNSRLAIGCWVDIEQEPSSADVDGVAFNARIRGYKDFWCWTKKPLKTKGLKPVSFSTTESPKDSVFYQLSPDGKTWYEFDPVAARWVEARGAGPDTAYYAYTGYARYPCAKAVNTGISAFRGIAGEELYVKAILADHDEFAGTSATLSDIKVTAEEDPAGAAEYYFAEGTTRPGFDTYFCVQNPGEQAAAVTLYFLRGTGEIVKRDVSVPPHSRSTVNASDSLGRGDDESHDFSTYIECTNGQGVFVERPMYFDYKGWTGGHTAPGALDSSDRFYFAEGTCRPGFDPYFCIMNPEDKDAEVILTYFKGDGTTATTAVNVPARTRRTVAPKDTLGVGDDAAHDFSTRIQVTNAGAYIVAERPMYFNYNGWTGGHDVMGERASSGIWYFAEGTCRPGFDPYLCIQNPRKTASEVKITYMLGDGTTKEHQVTIPPETRVTVNPKDTIGSADSDACDFSTVVQTTNNTQVICERPIYFNYKGAWTGGHDALGTLP